MRSGSRVSFLLAAVVASIVTLAGCSPLALRGRPVVTPGDPTLPTWEGGPAYCSRWTNGSSNDPSFFPIAVWLQDPSHADAYKAIGINVFVGL